MGSLSRFRDGVDHLFVTALVASGVRRAGLTLRRPRLPGRAQSTSRAAGIEPEPGSGEARFVGEPARGGSTPRAD